MPETTNTKIIGIVLSEDGTQLPSISFYSNTSLYDAVYWLEELIETRYLNISDDGLHLVIYGSGAREPLMLAVEKVFEEVLGTKPKYLQ